MHGLFEPPQSFEQSLPEWLTPSVHDLLETILAVAAELSRQPYAWMLLEHGQRRWLPVSLGLSPGTPLAQLPALSLALPGNVERCRGPVHPMAELIAPGMIELYASRRAQAGNSGLAVVLAVAGTQACPLDERQRAALDGQVRIAAKTLAHVAAANRDWATHPAADTIPAMVAFWDADARNRFANRAYLRWFGKSQEDICGRHISELLGAELYRQNLSYIDAALAGQEQCFEWPIAPPVQNTSRYLVRYIPHCNNDGQPDGFFALVTGIRADRVMQLRLAQHEAHYRQLYQLAPTMMHCINSDGRIISVNHTWLDKLGYRAEEVIGRKSVEFLTEASREYALNTALPEFFKHGCCNNIHYQMVGKQGELVDVLMSAVRLDSPINGSQSLAVMHDITAQKVMEKQLSEAKQTAEAANQAKTNFLAVVSHELRTPLHTILGYTGLLRKKVPAEFDEKLAIIEKSGTQLSRLIEDVLYYSRGEELPYHAPQHPIRLDALALDLESSGKLLAQNNGNLFAVKLDPALPEAIAINERHLLQILNNLIGNACKFTRHGEVSMALAPGQPPAGQAAAGKYWLHFMVSDTGSGIAPEEQQRIFEPFGRAAAHLHTPGLGLGLTITRQLVQNMGGSIWLDSELGRGSTFHVCLPVLAMASEKSAENDTSSRITGHDGPQRTLLVVDDSMENRLFLMLLCQQWGFHVLHADNGVEALKLIEEDSEATVDLVISEQYMPEMDGWMLLRTLRASPRHRSLPIMLVSAGPKRRPPDFPAEFSFNGVLLKPIEQKELAQQLQRLLRLEWRLAPQDAEVEALERVRLLPPEEQMQEFQQLLEMGQLVALREWAERLRHEQPQYEDFAQKVIRQCRKVWLEDLKSWLKPPL